MENDTGFGKRQRLSRSEPFFLSFFFLQVGKIAWWARNAEEPLGNVHPNQLRPMNYVPLSVYSSISQWLSLLKYRKSRWTSSEISHQEFRMVARGWWVYQKPHGWDDTKTLHLSRGILLVGLKKNESTDAALIGTKCAFPTPWSHRRQGIIFHTETRYLASIRSDMLTGRHEIKNTCLYRPESSLILSGCCLIRLRLQRSGKSKGTFKSGHVCFLPKAGRQNGDKSHQRQSI